VERTAEKRHLGEEFFPWGKEIEIRQLPIKQSVFIELSLAEHRVYSLESQFQWAAAMGKNLQLIQAE
jgi:hypothetical protein